MNYSSLEEVYGAPFGKRTPVTHHRKDKQEEPLQKPEFSSLADRAAQNIEKNKSLIDSITSSLPLATPAPPPPTTRERFSTMPSQPANIVTDFQESDKLSRILRLIEQNKTGYERPATQDMLLYIATGVFFLFTFDTFVMLGKSMRGK